MSSVVNVMADALAAVLGALVFLAFITLWNLITSSLPGSVSAGITFFMLLVAGITAIVVYLQSSRY